MKEHLWRPKVGGGQRKRGRPLHRETPHPSLGGAFGSVLLAHPPRPLSASDYTHVNLTHISTVMCWNHRLCELCSFWYEHAKVPSKLAGHITWRLRALWLFVEDGPSSESPFWLTWGLGDSVCSPVACCVTRTRKVHFTQPAESRQLPRKTQRGGPWELANAFALLTQFNGFLWKQWQPKKTALSHWSNSQQKNETLKYFIIS